MVTLKGFLGWCGVVSKREHLAIYRQMEEMLRDHLEMTERELDRLERKVGELREAMSHILLCDDDESKRIASDALTR